MADGQKRLDFLAYYCNAAQTWGREVVATGGVAPARAYIEQLLPDVLAGTINPGKVFTHTVGLDEVPGG